MEYKIREKNHDWLNKGPWYNTTIFSKLHGTVFEYFNRNDRTDIYSLMCSITGHDRQQSTYVDDVRSYVGRSIPKNATTPVLKSLGANLNFIACSLKRFQHNYQ